jgi:hypothetical protein
MKHWGGIVGGLIAILAIIYLGPRLIAALGQAFGNRTQSVGALDTLYNASRNADIFTGAPLPVPQVDPGPFIAYTPPPLDQLGNLPETAWTAGTGS